LLAGLLLAETEFRHEVEVTIEPFKGLLMGLFFMSVGMQIDVREIIRSPVWIPLAVLSLFAVKTLVTGVIFRFGGFHWGRAVESGVLLGQGGEFAFIVAAYALGKKLIAPEVAQFVMLVVGLSLFATPALARAARGFGSWWDRRHHHQLADLATGAAPPAGTVIIAGFGRVGQLLAKVLTEQDISYVAVENDARLVTTLHPRGFPVYFGDASRAELLQKLHADRACAVVLTMDHPASVLHAVRSIRREYPHLPVYARARDEAHAVALVHAGATLVVPEALEAALQLAATVLHTAGLTEARAFDIVQAERDRRNAVLLSKQLS
jgi:CPA2 family monovalent cation:H+ antiporter-2